MSSYLKTLWLFAQNEAESEKWPVDTTEKWPFLSKGILPTVQEALSSPGTNGREVGRGTLDFP